MITIDGSIGEGGGQILRTALSLAAVTGSETEISGIRAHRPKPGLMRQHLTAAEAVRTAARGCLEGAAPGASRLVFTPGAVAGGEYRFAIGTAGSTVLVAQALLPVLATAATPSTLTLEGGTHALHAPVFEYFDRVYLPLLRRMGLEAAATLERHGFYPAGGGVIRLEIRPWSAPRALELTDAGPLAGCRGAALVSGLEYAIAADEARLIAEGLGLAPESIRAYRVDAASQGNAAWVEVEHEHVTELFSVVGEPGLSRQAVAARTVGLVRKYLECGAPVGPHLADQLLLPLALGAGGRFVSSEPTPHTLTNLRVIRQFLPVEIGVERLSEHQYLFEVKK